MTREEAIRIFRKEIECMSHTKCSDCILEKVCDPITTTPLDSEYIEAFGMAIEALSATCSEKPNNCEDAISRQAVLDLAEWFDLNQQHFTVANLIDEVENIPSVTPKQRIGHWVKISPAGIYECSECGQNVMTGDIDAYRHCHGCGARMESED